MSAVGDDADLLHARLGHFSASRINSALHNNDSGIFGSIKHDSTNCEACMLNRTKKVRPKESSTGTVYSHFGQRISSDTCGPFPESPNGFLYAINFYDHYSKFCAVYYLKDHSASEVLGALQTFLTDYKEYMTDTITPGVVESGTAIMAASSSRLTLTSTAAR